VNLEGSSDSWAFAASAYRLVFGNRAAFRFSFGGLAVVEVSTASSIQIAATELKNLRKLELFGQP
jgi:hypothetical protein